MLHGFCVLQHFTDASHQPMRLAPHPAVQRRSLGLGEKRLVPDPLAC